MSAKKLAPLLMLLFLMSAGCSDDSGGRDSSDIAQEDVESEDIRAGEREPDAQTDAEGREDIDEQGSPDADSDPSPEPDAGELVFRLKNRTSRTFYTYPDTAGSPCQRQVGWLRLSVDGELISPSQDCTRCECGVEDCTVCTLDCSSDAVEVHAGGAREFKWDKKIWALDQVDACQRAELALGQEVRAEFCWGEESDEDTGAVGEYQCEAKTVTVGDGDQIVEFEVDQGQDEWQPGDIYKSKNDWLEARVGDMPLVISAPHGGNTMPNSIPTRTCGSPTTVRDTGVDLLAVELSKRLKQDHGKSPYLVIAHIKRPKIDLNRDLYPATCGNDEMVEVWHQYHDYIETALAQAIDQYGYAIYIDLHGHGHTKQRLELGYARTKASLKKSHQDASEAERLGKASSLGNLTRISDLSFQEMLTGDKAFGTLVHAAGTPAVPSQQDPFPLDDDKYFNGGYNTRRYTHADYSRVFGWQIETHSGARTGDNPDANRKKFAKDFSKSITEYIEHVEPRIR